MNRKEWHLFETEILYKIINVFTITTDQFSASLLKKKKKKKKRFSFKKKYYSPHTFEQ